ncbi:BON domain-containing protein [Rhodoferax sp. PAMC 29310]|uniref:BON domain-containing protein n=1 Tax=Rhodoferax sp. PAMC 29310 TaxID=2822760 RepID=UPI001B3215BF|nr:BON domain-containing protein [Rhodoferax sp. PAMC 29310]
MKFRVQKRLALVLAVASLAGALSACAPLVLGGALVGGMMVSDRRTSGSQVEDEGIELRASSRIRENLGERVHVNVTSYNRQVLLTGEVPSPQDKQLVEQVVARVDNVRSIVNELGVLGNSTLTQRASDTLVTGKVKASLLDAKDLFANSFKVVTERGTVYLMGRVTQREATRVTDIARGTGGVQKVVRVLEVISEDELKNMGGDSTIPAPQ